MPSAEPIITVGMIARPSSPSVRLTALLVPTMTKYDSAMNPHTPSGYETVLKKGTIRSAFGESPAENPLSTHARNRCPNVALFGAETENARETAATMPIIDCQKNLARAGRPFGLRATTLRQSSTQPTAPKPSVTSSTSQTKRLSTCAQHRVV